MKCGVGKCGRCNIGSKYVCKDGPVFRFDKLDELTGRVLIGRMKTTWQIWSMFSCLVRNTRCPLI